MLPIRCPVAEFEQVILGAIAHGGDCVARLPGDGAGRVMFVRGGIPGEKVLVRVTNAKRAAWWRGVVVEVVDASPNRVTPPCPVAGICGGCDFQHISLARQRMLKAQVVAQQLRQLAGVEWPNLTVEPVPGDVDGLAWRTRMRYLVNSDAVGLRAHASHDLVVLPPQGCPLATPGGPRADELASLAGGASEVAVTVANSGVTVWVPGDSVVEGSLVVGEWAATRGYLVRADGFWQVHPGAATALVQAVTTMLHAQPGEPVLDLYCGVGLFAGAMGDAIVDGVEGDRAAVDLARQNVPKARFEAGLVQHVAWDASGHLGVVVLDPPRAGAGRDIVQRVATCRPRAVAYVACDPASLARDIAIFADLGYELTALRAFDIFPMTSHVECVALLTPVSPGMQ